MTDPPTGPSRDEEIRAGLVDVLPILLAVIPFGMIAGVAAVSAGLSTVLSVATSAIVFAGAAQLAVMSLLEAGAAWPTILGTVVVINTRMVMYSGTLARPLGHASRAWRWLMSYLMVDQVFALTVLRSDEDRPHPYLHWYYASIGGAAWVVWMAATWVGVVVGNNVPESWGLSFAAPLIFLALIFPAVVDRATFWAAVASGVTAVAAAAIPFNLGLLMAAVVGIVTGVTVDRYA